MGAAALMPGDAERELFETFMESQYWPRGRLESFQRQRLTRLVRHAQDHVPFYGDRLGGLFDEAGELDWDKWGDIPLLYREDLMAHGPETRSRALPPGHGAVG